jgi:hypothetical protein
MAARGRVQCWGFGDGLKLSLGWKMILSERCVVGSLKVFKVLDSLEVWGRGDVLIKGGEEESARGRMGG